MSKNELDASKEMYENSSPTSRTSTYGKDDFSAADPLPFDYHEYSTTEVNNREILSMAHTVMNEENNRIAAFRQVSEGNPRGEYTNLSSNLNYGLEHAASQQSIQQQYMAAYSMPGSGGHAMHPMYQQHMMYNNPLHNIPQAAPSSYQAMFESQGGRKELSTYPSAHPNYTSSGYPIQDMSQHDANMTYTHNPATFAHLPYINTQGPAMISDARQELSLKLTTPLKEKYWRNGRRNFQCFPSCKVYGDYSNIKIEELKHHDFMWGKCRGSLFVEVAMNHPIQREDLLVLARIHSLDSVPTPVEETVRKEAMIGHIISDEAMKGYRADWIVGEQVTDADRYEFKPKVWKYDADMSKGKCKRNLKYYVQIEAFRQDFLQRSWIGIGSGASHFFEVGSSRVLARQKRKAAEREGIIVEPSNGKKIKADKEAVVIPPLNFSPLASAAIAPTTEALSMLPVISSTENTNVDETAKCVAEIPV